MKNKDRAEVNEPGIGGLTLNDVLDLPISSRNGLWTTNEPFYFQKHIDKLM